MNTKVPETKFTVLVLAASRAGPEDAVASLQGVSHKCLVEIDGEVMLQRVVREITASRYIRDVYISIESEDLIRQVPMLSDMMDEGRLHYIPARKNLFESVLAADEAIPDPYPLIVSTGDNALHTPDMLDHFCQAVLAADMDGAVGMTPASTILEAYPDGKRAFHELKDGGWSSCNLYAAKTRRAIEAAKVFRTGGQFGKRPGRIMKAFGIPFMLMYKLRLATADGLARYLSRRWNLDLRIVRMPFADAPIDVDNPGDFHRTEAILKARRGAA